MPYRFHLLVAAALIALLLVIGLGDRVTILAPFVIFGVMLLDPIILIASICAGAFIRKPGIMLAVAIGIGLAIHVLVVVLNEGRTIPGIYLVLRPMAAIGLATVAHAVATAIRTSRAAAVVRPQ